MITAGRLTQVHENSQLLATYTYNAQGQRTIKTTPSGTIYYMYDGSGRLLGEYDDTGQPIKEYVRLDGEPIAQLESSNITYLHSDHLATPRKATNEVGEVVWEWDSEAFGNKPPESGGPTVNIRFPGQYYDSETRLYYNYYRYYDPSTGRYISSDPIGLRGGLNTYIYVNANPIAHIDIYGLSPTIKTKCPIVEGYSLVSSDVSVFPQVCIISSHGQGETPKLICRDPSIPTACTVTCRYSSDCEGDLPPIKRTI